MKLKKEKKQYVRPESDIIHVYAECVAPPPLTMSGDHIPADDDGELNAKQQFDFDDEVWDFNTDNP
ncbi:hypothetical protein [Prevotella koreensis]